MKEQAYLYTFHATKEQPCTFANLNTFVVCPRDIQSMRKGGPKTSLNLPLPLWPLQIPRTDDPRIVAINKKLSAPVDILGFDASFYKHMDIWFTLHQVTDVIDPQ